MKKLLFLLILVGCLCSSCSLTKLVDVPVDPELVNRVKSEVTRMENRTGLRMRKPYQIRAVRAHFIDAQGYAAAFSPAQKISVGWVNVGNPYVLTLPVVSGKRVPTKVITHEALHLVLLSNGIPGHPEEYRELAWRWHNYR